MKRKIIYRDWVSEHLGVWLLLAVENRKSRTILHLQCPCGDFVERETQSMWLWNTKCEGCGASYEPPSKEMYENTPSWKEISELLHYKSASDAKASYMVAIEKLRLLLPDYEDLVPD